MRRFISVWLVWIMVAVFAVAILASYIPLTRQAEMTARDDLTMLTNAAFIQIDKAERNVDAALESANANLLSKGRAIVRFTAHDDSLLATDALVALCEMLDTTSIDITDGEGTVVYASAAENLGKSLAGDATLPFVEDALENDAEMVQQDGADAAMLVGCVPRTDTEGLVLIKTKDASVMEAQSNADPETVLMGMSFVNDLLRIAKEEGIDGSYIMDGYFCVRATQRNVSVVAARALNSVYLIRNAVLLALSLFALLSIIASLVIQILLAGTGRQHYVVKRPAKAEMLPSWMTAELGQLPQEEEPLRIEEALPQEQPAGQGEEQFDEPEQSALPNAPKKRKKRRVKEPAERLSEEASQAQTQPTENETPEAAEPVQQDQNAPLPEKEPNRLPERKRTGRMKRGGMQPQENDSAFDKIF